jgi:hypothetical protein
MPRLACSVLGSCLFLRCTLGPTAAFAEKPTGWVADRKLDPVPPLSTELLDPSGTSRFHLVGRVSFADSAHTFSSSSLWSFEGRAHIRVIEGLALSAVLPFGYFSQPGSPKEFFVGNFAVGVGGGGRILLTDDPSGEGRAPAIRIGGALDVYAPTAPKPAADDLFLAIAEIAVARMRAYEPYLYLANLMSFRGRAHADVTLDIFHAGFELGLTPAFTLSSSSEFYLWFSAAGRGSIRPTEWLEPFVEIGSAILILGPDTPIALPGGGSTKSYYSPPLRVTPGVRLHFLALDPAVFASFSFKESKSILFGLDLAGALRGSRSDLSEDIFRGFGN